MPGRHITRLPNRAARVLFLITIVIAAGVLSAIPTQPQPAPPQRESKPQSIISFHHVDIPVSIGIIIDNSGSMREKRNKVNQAALNLVRSSNPKDEVFVVNFNDEYYLDQDFTNNLLKLKEALEKIDARGGTALFDAVVASADQLKYHARLEKKVLFIVTDGEDTASTETLEQAVKHLQEENGPSVYAIG